MHQIMPLAEFADRISLIDAVCRELRLTEKLGDRTLGSMLCKEMRESWIEFCKTHAAAVVATEIADEPEVTALPQTLVQEFINSNMHRATVKVSAKIDQVMSKIVVR